MAFTVIVRSGIEVLNTTLPTLEIARGYAAAMKLKGYSVTIFDHADIMASIEVQNLITALRLKIITLDQFIERYVSIKGSGSDEAS